MEGEESACLAMDGWVLQFFLIIYLIFILLTEGHYI
jgi:hypothetical protein